MIFSDASETDVYGSRVKWGFERKIAECIVSEGGEF